VKSLLPLKKISGGACNFEEVKRNWIVKTMTIMRWGAKVRNRSAVRFGTWSRRKIEETSIAIEEYYIVEEE
jgi:hypothetical protein